MEPSVSSSLTLARPTVSHSSPDTYLLSIPPWEVPSLHTFATSPNQHTSAYVRPPVSLCDIGAVSFAMLTYTYFTLPSLPVRCKNPVRRPAKARICGSLLPYAGCLCSPLPIAPSTTWACNNTRSAMSLKSTAGISHEPPPIQASTLHRTFAPRPTCPEVSSTFTSPSARSPSRPTAQTASAALVPPSKLTAN
jgi:hypothetical protein